MTAPDAPRAAPRTAGRYEVHGEIASGGMATVYFGRLAGAIGFSRIVAVKRMLPRLSRDPELVAMFVNEATLASRVVHPNVVPVLDVVVEDGEIFIVMEYVRGQSLAALLGASLRAGAPVPVPIAAAVMAGALAGLHAAHEARDKRGQPLGIVHRDVSPQNILVGADGVARVMDFGVAEVEGKLRASPDGPIAGKASYMAPEQVRGDALDRRVDVFAAGVVLWGMLVGRRLFRGEDASVMNEVLHGEIPPVARLRPDVPAALDAALGAALARDPSRRPASARDFALALEAAVTPASPSAVGAWVESLAAPVLAQREAIIAQIEDTSIGHAAAPQPSPSRDSQAPTRTWIPSALEGASSATTTGVALAPASSAHTTARRGPPSSRARGSAAWMVGVSAAFAAIAVGAAVVVLTRATAPAPAALVAPSASAPIPAASPPPDAPTTTAAASIEPPVASAATAPAPSAKPPPAAKGKGRPRPRGPSSKPADDLGFIPSANQ